MISYKKLNNADVSLVLSGAMSPSFPCDVVTESASNNLEKKKPDKLVSDTQVKFGAMRPSF